MQIKKDVVAKLIDQFSNVDKLSRHKNADISAVLLASVKAARSALTVLRKLK